MNDLQAKLLSAILLPVGLALLAFGGYELFTAWQHNQDLVEADRAVGGLLNAFNDALGSDMRMSYERGAVLAGIGAVFSLLGVVALGRVGHN